MAILTPETTVVYTRSGSTYHRVGATCGGINNPNKTEVQCIPHHKPCGTCYPGGVKIDWTA